MVCHDFTFVNISYHILQDPPKIIIFCFGRQFLSPVLFVLGVHINGEKLFVSLFLKKKKKCVQRRGFIAVLTNTATSYILQAKIRPFRTLVWGRADKEDLSIFSWHTPVYLFSKRKEVIWWFPLERVIGSQQVSSPCECNFSFDLEPKLNIQPNLSRIRTESGPRLANNQVFMHFSCNLDPWV